MSLAVWMMTTLTIAYVSTQNLTTTNSYTSVTSTGEVTDVFLGNNVTHAINSSTSEPTLASYDIWAYIGFVTVPLFIVIGVVGNVFTMIIMRADELKQNAHSYILFAIAISDTIVNLMYPFNKQFVRTLIGRDMRALSTFGCHLFFVLWRTVKMSTSWLVVLISLERFVAVVYPFKAAKLIVKTRVLVAIATIYILLSVYNSYWSSVTDRLVGPFCIPNTRPADHMQLSYVLILIGNIVYSPIPCLILFITTSVIVYALRRSYTERKSLTGEQTQVQDNTQRVTGMLLGVCVAFLILVTPISIGHLLSIFAGINILQSTDPSVTIYREMAQLMEQINHSINFFLYVVSSAEFRRAFWDILRGRGNRRSLRKMRSMKWSSSVSSSGSDARRNLRISTIAMDENTGTP